MPRLWRTTIEDHRREVRDAILDATGALVHERGPMALTMSQIAEDAGIGRATLYKYFPDAQAVLAAWHERHVSAHLADLVSLRERSGSSSERLQAVLDSYAGAVGRRDGSDIARLLHGEGHVADADARVLNLIEDLVRDGATTGELRADVPADELAQFCVSALEAARSVRSKAAVRRLVSVTMEALQPPSA